MKIICIGRNYSEHAKELNNPIPKSPIFFLKPDSAILKKGQAFFIPEHSQEIHHEIEVLVRINRIGKHIEPKFSHKYYDEIGLGIDFTARDAQEDCKKNGLPWEIAKAFDGSAPIGSFYKKSELGDLNDLNFELLKNGELVQKGNTKDMIFNIDYLVSYLSKFFTLKIGDIIFTGTPSGVGKVEKGDILEGTLNSKNSLRLKIC